MRTVAILLVCLASAGHGRRQPGSANTLRPLAHLLVALNPANTWQLVGNGHHLSLKTLESNRVRLQFTMNSPALQDQRLSTGPLLEEHKAKRLQEVPTHSQPAINGAAAISSSSDEVPQRPDMAPIFEVHDVATAHQVVDRLLALPETTFHACDTEVADLDIDKSPVGQGRVICLSIYSGPDVDYGRGPGQALWVDTSDLSVLEAFRPFLECERILKVWHNYGFDRHVLWNHGIDVRGFGGDTMHMARLWDASRLSGYSLEALTDELVGRRKAPMKELFGVPVRKKDGTPGKKIALPPVADLQNNPETRAQWIDYSVYDSQGTWLLHDALSRKLRGMDWQDGTSLFDFYMGYWRPFGELLTDMEREGIKVDATTLLPAAQKQAEEDLTRLVLNFRKWAASYYPAAWFMNPSSGTQIGTLLFGGEQNLKTKTYLPPKKTFKMTREEFDELLSLAEKEYDFKADLTIADRIRARDSGTSASADEDATIALSGYSYDGRLSADALKLALLDGSIKLKGKFVEFELTSMGLSVPQTTKKGAPKTDAATLSSMAGRPFDDPPKYGSVYEQFGGGDAGKNICEALASLVDVRTIEKVLSSFILPLQENADKHSRVHTALNLNTETGRLSSRAPNLQNQPALEKDQWGIRKAFHADEGKTFVVADYGQLELRLLAHIATCRSMIDAFKSGGCFHSRTAMGMFDHVREAVERGDCLLEWDYSKGKPPAPLLKDAYGSERRKAKTLNFSIAYGKTVVGLSKDWGVSVEEAQKILNAWYADRPEVQEWQRNTIDTAHRTGWTRTLMGRYRLLPGIKNGKRHVVEHLERAAINTPIQGGAADIMTLAMLKLKRSPKLKELGYKILLQIHDEVILEGPKEHAEAAKAETIACMEHPFDEALPKLQVDLVVDAKTADNWFEAK